MTTTIIADVAQNVVGNLPTVVSLIPPETDVHSFIPSPHDVKTITAADVVLINDDMGVFVCRVGSGRLDTICRDKACFAPTPKMGIVYDPPDQLTAAR